MIHIIEEFWRFKGFGIFFSILIAVLIVSLREAPKYIKDPQKFQLFTRIALVLLFLIGIVAIKSLLSKPVESNDTKAIPAETEIAPEFVVNNSFPTDEQNAPIEDTTSTLTRDFIVGTWNVVSKDSTIDEEIRFTSAGDDKVEVDASYSNHIIFGTHLHAVPWYKIVSTNSQYHQEAKLDLWKSGSKMNGRITKIDLGAMGISKPILISEHELTFTRK